jgi:glucans biosynthesis protein C
MFPYYILHQTLIVLVGYWFTMHRAPAALEAAAIIAATLIGCAAGYEIVRRVAILRPLFGLSLRRQEEQGASPGVPELAMR